jgi:ArsR family transcriptional regulator, arsenate/arsenite/antimonite-responsive transcriptional repressor
LTAAGHFNSRKNMEMSDAVIALAALAQDHRLAVYRLLVQAGPSGLPAGVVAEALGLPPNTLTFHFDRLRQAGLVTVRREGRSMIYSARYDTMDHLLGYLTENCCKGAEEACAPRVKCKPVRGKKRSTVSA